MIGPSSYFVNFQVVNILPSIIKDGCTGEVDIGDFLDYIPLDALPEISQDACHEFQIHKWDRVSCKTGKLVSTINGHYNVNYTIHVMSHSTIAGLNYF